MPHHHITISSHHHNTSYITPPHHHIITTHHIHHIIYHIITTHHISHHMSHRHITSITSYITPPHTPVRAVHLTESFAILSERSLMSSVWVCAGRCAGSRRCGQCTLSTQHTALSPFFMHTLSSLYTHSLLYTHTHFFIYTHVMLADKNAGFLYIGIISQQIIFY